jgi:hypothetical protein
MNSMQYNNLETEYTSRDEMINSVFNGQDVIEALCPGEVKIEDHFKWHQLVILIIALLLVYVKNDMSESDMEMVNDVLEDTTELFVVLLALWYSFRRRKLDDLVVLGKDMVCVFIGVYEDNKSKKVTYEKVYIMERKKVSSQFNFWKGLSFKVSGFIKVELEQGFFFNPKKEYGEAAKKTGEMKKLMGV